MGVKISQFYTGITMRVNDIVAGLRTVSGVINDYQFDFPGVGINDSAGNPLLRWTPGTGTSVNYLEFMSASSTNPPSINAAGADDNVNLAINAKGTGHAYFGGTGAFGVPVGTTAQEPAGFAGGLRYDTDTDFLRYWDIGVDAWVDIIAGAAFDDETYITKLDSTANLPNSQPLAPLPTGFMQSTTTTGVVNTRTLATASAARITITNPAGIAGNPTFDLAMTGVVSGTYTNATVTVDVYGRCTTVANGTTAVTAVGATLPLVSSGGLTPTIAMQGLTGLAQGDLIYGDTAANTFARLAKDANATRYLSNTGTTNAPAWSQVNLANGVTGVLPSANGGTSVNNGTNTMTYGTNVVNPINQNGAQIYAVDAVGTDAYAITLTPALGAYVDGMTINFKAGTANTGPATLSVNGLGAIPINKLNDVALDTGDIEANQITTVIYNSSGTPRFSMISQTAQAATGTVTSVATGTGLRGGTITNTGTINLSTQLAMSHRLSLVSGSPAAEAAGATTLYLVPYKGTDIDVYDGTNWVRFQQTQLSITTAGLSASTTYDVFYNYNAGTPNLVLTAWANSTPGAGARATALAYQNGVLVKSGTTTQRYVGTVYSNASTQFDDVSSARGVWNYYNRVTRAFTFGVTAASWGQANNNTWEVFNSSGSIVSIVVGVVEDNVYITVALLGTAGGPFGIAVGQNSKTSPSITVIASSPGIPGGGYPALSGYYDGLPTLGYQYYVPLEYAPSVSAGWYGNNIAGSASGLVGTIPM